MKEYRDPTFDEAVGAVSKEWRMMAAIAVKIREAHCNPMWADAQLPRFTGIFRRLLEDPLDEVKAQVKGKG